MLGAFRKQRMHDPAADPHPKSTLPAVQYIDVSSAARTLQFHSIGIAITSRDAVF
jgi:hypothetical protein